MRKRYSQLIRNLARPIAESLRISTVAFAVATAWSAPSRATTFVERPFPDAVQEAPVIVRGKVGMSYANWVHGTDGGKRIYTFTELKVDEAFKGSVNSPTLIFRELGGEKDGMGMQVAGTAQFQRGEDVVVFLSTPNADGSFDLRGMMMGKYNVERNADGEETLRGPGLGGAGHEHGEQIAPGAQNENIAAQNDTSHRSKWTLEDLRKLVSSQQGRDSSTPKTEKTKSPPIVTPRPAAPAREAKTAPSQAAEAAPVLQLTPEEQAGFRWDRIAAGLAMAGGVVFFFRALIRRKKNRG